MKRVLIFAVAAWTLLTAAPAFAAIMSAPIPAEGITPAEMVQLLAQHEMSPKLGQSSDGQPIINGRSGGLGFYVSFSECRGDRCQDVYFRVGWSNAKANAQLTTDKINAWNNGNTFLRAYLSPDNTLWAAMDARVAYGTTANVEAYIQLWRTQLHEFRSFMRL
ncbi:MAG: YbjN domain-containing protein [Stellaceae bacterium]